MGTVAVSSSEGSGQRAAGRRKQVVGITVSDVVGSGSGAMGSRQKAVRTPGLAIGKLREIVDFYPRHGEDQREQCERIPHPARRGS